MNNLVTIQLWTIESNIAQKHVEAGFDRMQVIRVQILLSLEMSYHFNSKSTLNGMPILMAVRAFSNGDN